MRPSIGPTPDYLRPARFTWAGRIGIIVLALLILRSGLAGWLLVGLFAVH